jgi:pSer/pThr/pTyr-binding forkhead associated (FHA) protein
MANSLQEAFCRHCFDCDLTAVVPEPLKKDTEMPDEHAEASVASVDDTEKTPTSRIMSEQVCVLNLLENPLIRFIIHDGQTAGRTEQADVILRDVPDLHCISGIHAKFFRRKEQWYVQHLGHTNFIKVDGEVFNSTEEEIPIQEGTILVLSLTPFRVSFTTEARS